MKGIEVLKLAVAKFELASIASVVKRMSFISNSEMQIAQGGSAILW